jgi:hypothetical protein
MKKISLPSTIKTRTVAMVAVVLLVLGFATACGDKFTEPFKDAPRSHKDTGTPTDVIRFADGFSNVGTSCDRFGNRVYVAYHGGRAYASIFVIQNASSC